MTKAKTKLILTGNNSKGYTGEVGGIKVMVRTTPSLKMWVREYFEGSSMIPADAVYDFKSIIKHVQSELDVKVVIDEIPTTEWWQD